MKKIAFIFPPLLPMPAVKGGATETLIQRLIDDNEKYGEFQFRVFCCYDPEAEQSGKKYKNTRFSYIKKSNSIIERMRFLWFRFRRKFSKSYVPEPYLTQIAAELNKETYDAVIVESSLRFVPYLKENTQNTVLLHLHFDAVASGQQMLDQGLHFCDGVVCVSHFIRKTICDYDSTIPTWVLPNVTDVSYFDSRRYTKQVAELKEKFGLTDEPVILYSGRLTPSKGVLELVQAYKLALEQVPNMKLILAGSAGYGATTRDEYYHTLIEEIGQLKGKCVFLTGYVEHEKMPVYYALADVAVLPTTLVEEAAPLSVLEAQASGCYFVGSDSGAIGELLCTDYGAVVKRGERYVENLVEQLLVAARHYRRGDHPDPTPGRRYVLEHHNGENYYGNFAQLMQKI